MNFKTQKSLDKKIINILKNKYNKKDVNKFYTKIKISRKNDFGYINPIKYFFNSPPEIINFTKELLKKRYHKFKFDKKIIENIFDYLKKNKKNNSIKSANFIRKNIYSFKEDYFKKLSEYIPVRYNLTYKYLKKTYNFDKHKNLIDLGAGTNDLGTVIIKNNKKIKVIGIDIMQYNSKIKMKNLSYVKQLKSFDIPKKEIDIIILNGVLHHIDYLSLDILLNNLNNKLKKNGKIILFEDTWNFSSPKKFIDTDAKANAKFLLLSKKYPKKINAVNIFLEWFGILLVRNYKKMSLPYNFLSLEEWKLIFKNKNLKFVKNLNIGFFKNTLHRQSYNVIVFKKDKIKKVNNFLFIENYFKKLLKFKI